MCWGTTSGEIPAGRFTGIAAAGRQTCAIREADAGVDCWGQSFWGLTEPAGAFRSIAGGGEQFCGVHTEGTLACWGGDPWSGVSEVPAGTYTSVEVGGTTRAASARPLRGLLGLRRLRHGPRPRASFTAVAAGTSHSCGVRAAGGELVCWGAERMLDTPAGSYRAVSAGVQFSCALRADDGVPVCWGADVGDPKNAPAVALAMLVTGARHSCGVRRGDEGVTCWGAHALDIPEDLRIGNVDSDGDGHRDGVRRLPGRPGRMGRHGRRRGVGDNGDAFPADPGGVRGHGRRRRGRQRRRFPTDPAEPSDTDGDGVGDNGDRFPADPAEPSTDSDGVGDNGDNCRERRSSSPTATATAAATRDTPPPAPKPTAGDLAREPRWCSARSRAGSATR